MGNFYCSLFIKKNVLLVLFFKLLEEILQCSAVGQWCDLTKLEQCNRNEVCKAGVTGRGECQCVPGFEPDRSGMCQQIHPDAGGSSSAAYAVAIIITIVVIIIAAVTVVMLHQRYNMLVPLTALCPSCGAVCSGLCDSIQRCFSAMHLPSINLFGVRSGRSRMMDDLSAREEEEDDPVV